MRVALVQPSDLGPGERSKQVLVLTAALRRLGHEAVALSPVVHGTEDLAEPASMSDLCDPSAWRRRGVDGVVAVTWLHQAAVLRAAREAGLPTIALADSDGKVVPWRHPRNLVLRAAGTARHAAAVRMSVVPAPAGGRVGTPPAVTTSPPGPDPSRLGLRARIDFGARVRAAVAVADWTGVSGRPALDDYRATLQRLGIAIAPGRIGISEQAAAPHFVGAPLDGPRQREVLAIGRWYAAQKDPLLLRATLRELLAHDPEVRVTIVGPGAGQVIPRHARVEALDAVPNAELPELLTRAAVLLSTSRWEGGSATVFSEAVTCGCPVVGPSLNAVAHAAGGGHGSVMVAGRSPARLAAAALRVVDAWDDAAGRRLAAAWRPRLDPLVVAADLAARLSSPTAPG
ncbi:hypothetical protein DSM112329_00807 [Paraconexibacter sp. AEG42_29]|uniref:Glycosyltransferase n=1 Tax=Paraconexibacter sp. AEG42_29 TaxID=2997339 RepID=A0AAU7AR59_9ACTN